MLRKLKLRGKNDFLIKKNIAYVLFWVFQICLATTTTDNSINLWKTLC